MLRSALWRRGLRGYRVNLGGLPGRPDVAWTKRLVAVFVDGAFWHGHPSAYKPGKSGEYWDAKIARNMARDRAANEALETAGWQVVRLWDFEIRKRTEDCVDRIEGALLRSSKTFV